MELFKYYTFNTRNLSAIKQNAIWFAEPSSFNDPFDCQLRLSCEHDELFLEKTADFISSEKSLLIDHNWLRMELGILREGALPYRDSSDYLTLGFAHTYYEAITRFDLDSKRYNLFLLSAFPSIGGTFSEIRTFITTVENTGISCFAKFGSDPKMWAHYADNHKGFCVQYHIQEQDLPEDILLKHIEYVDTARPDTPVTGAFDKADIIKQLTVKHTVWAHEGEVRLVSFLKGIGLKTLPITFEKLCFGHGMSQEDRDFIQDYLGLEQDCLFRAIPNRRTMRILWEITGGFAEPYED